MTYLKEKELPKVEKRLEIKNEVEDEPIELYIYGAIRPALTWDDEDDGNYISADAVRKKLNEIPSDEELNVHINSPGGEVFESIAIRNLLLQHKGDVKIIIDGLAASGASVVATAGEVVMFENTMQMIHKAWGLAIGNADDMMDMATDLEKIDESVLASYMEKFVGEEDELKELIREETWLTAEECLAFGFADKIWKDDDADNKEEKDKPENNVKENLFLKYNKKTEKREGEPDNKKSGLFNAFKKTQEVKNNEK